MSLRDMPVKRRWILPVPIALWYVAILSYCGVWISTSPLYIFFVDAAELLKITALFCGFVLILPITIVIAWHVFRHVIRTRSANIFQLTGVIILIFVTVMTGFFFLGMAMFGDSYEHQTSIHFSNHSYHLAAHNTYDDLGYGRFELFECDGLGIACRSVFRTDWGVDTSGTASMFVEGDTLAILIDDWNGDEVFYYMP